MSDKVNYKWLVLVLGLEVPRRHQAMHQGWLLIVLGPFSKRYGAHQGRCCLLERFLGKSEV